MADDAVFGTHQEEYERALKQVKAARTGGNRERIDAALDVLSMARDALELSNMTTQQIADGMTGVHRRRRRFL